MNQFSEYEYNKQVDDKVNSPMRIIKNLIFASFTLICIICFERRLFIKINRYREFFVNERNFRKNF